MFCYLCTPKKEKGLLQKEAGAKIQVEKPSLIRREIWLGSQVCWRVETFFE
jgi:hypothetical protein